MLPYAFAQPAFPFPASEKTRVSDLEAAPTADLTEKILAVQEHAGITAIEPLIVGSNHSLHGSSDHRVESPQQRLAQNPPWQDGVGTSCTSVARVTVHQPTCASGADHPAGKSAPVEPVTVHQPACTAVGVRTSVEPVTVHQHTCVVTVEQTGGEAAAVDAELCRHPHGPLQGQPGPGKTATFALLLGSTLRCRGGGKQKYASAAMAARLELAFDIYWKSWLPSEQTDLVTASVATNVRHPWASRSVERSVPIPTLSHDGSATACRLTSVPAHASHCDGPRVRAGCANVRMCATKSLKQIYDGLVTPGPGACRRSSALSLLLDTVVGWRSGAR